MGNCLFYLTIKGGTYSMPKLNLGKVVGDKGDSFVFEDFTPEQLDGLTPKMLKGNVTTLDPDQNATVDIRKDGLNNYIDFGIPRGKNGSEIKSISAENVEMANGNTLENAMTAANESISGIEEPAFDDTTSTYTTLAESNTAAETTSNAIQSHTSIFSTLSNMKKSLSAIVQGLKILGTNVGGIHGISSALDSQREDIAASSKAVSVLNSNLQSVGNNLKSKYFAELDYGKMVDLASYLVNGQTKTFMPLSSGIIEISMYSMTTETISVSITQHGLTRYLTVSPSGGIINAYCDIIVNTAAVSIRTYGTPVLRHAKFIPFKKL